MEYILLASKTVLGRRLYAFAFLLATPAVAFLLFLIPVYTVPGNNIAFELKLFGARDYLMLFSVAAMESLLLVMFFYLFRRARTQKEKLSAFGQGNLGIMSGVPAFLFGAKLCPLCIAAVFGFLGTGAVFSIFEYRAWIFGISAAVLFLSIYFVARKINRACWHCGLPEQHKQP